MLACKSPVPDTLVFLFLMLDSATVVFPPTPPAKGKRFGHRYSVVFLSLCGQPHYPGPSDGHPCTPTLHTGGGIQANQWPQRSQQMIKVSLGLFFCLGPSLLFTVLSGCFFFSISAPFLRGPSRNVGLRGKPLGPGWCGPRARPLPPFILPD